MTKLFLIDQLEKMQNAKRVNRLSVANLVLKNPDLVPYLLEIVFNEHSKLAIKAAWTLELVLEQKLDWLTPYLAYFVSNIFSVTHGSAVRPISKICNFMAIAYHSKKESLLKEFLTEKHIEKIIETGFDWMISNHKVAVKVYTMNTLFLFGKNYGWVHQELQSILQQNILKETAAYKSRGKKILNLLTKPF